MNKIFSYKPRYVCSCVASCRLSVSGYRVMQQCACWLAWAWVRHTVSWRKGSAEGRFGGVPAGSSLWPCWQIWCTPITGDRSYRKIKSSALKHVEELNVFSLFGVTTTHEIEKQKIRFNVFLLVLTCILLDLRCMFSPFFHKIFEANHESLKGEVLVRVHQQLAKLSEWIHWSLNLSLI